MKLPILKTTLALALGLAAWTGQPVNAANDITPIGTGNPYLPCGNTYPMESLACLKTQTTLVSIVPIS